MKLFVSWSMANIIPARSNLKSVVFISQKPRNKKGLARVKVNDSSQSSFDDEHNFEVLFSANTKPHLGKKAAPRMPAKDLQKVFDWVELNKALLLEYWDKKNDDTVDIVNRLIPVEED